MDFIQVLDIFTRGNSKTECSEIILPLALVVFQCREDGGK
jgi:hypothetical protein